jgi:hypothetical protein
MRRVALLSVALLTLAGCAPLEPYTGEAAYIVTGECAGVEVVVNYGTLAKRKALCVETTEATIAKELLAEAGVKTEGTATYGDQIVCRVNGLPAAGEPVVVPGQEPHSETCQNMPPAFAYWGVWVKANPEAEWEYAKEGVGSLMVQPGQSIGLAFATGGKAPTPN